MIFVNYKTFLESSGEAGLNLTKQIEDVARDTQIKIIPVVQAIDAQKIISSTTLPVWIQHVDPITYGANTGWTLPETVSKIGALGVFLNHSEHKFKSFEELKAANERSLSSNLQTLIFAGDLDELKKVCSLTPTFVSYEPAEFIGSTSTSVAEAKPEIIAEAAKIAKEFGIPLIVGAGIKSTSDVKKSLELGAVGIAIATGVIKAPDPKAKLLELIEGFK